MSASFTPGPYRAGRYSSMLGCPVMAQPDPAENSIVICSVYGGLSDDPDNRRAECEATATLFSAAPDMYEALSDLMENPVFLVSIGGNPNMVDALMVRARAALAKARG